MAVPLLLRRGKVLPWAISAVQRCHLDPNYLGHSVTIVHGGKESIPTQWQDKAPAISRWGDFPVEKKSIQ
jgi:hypothetical protein